MIRGVIFDIDGTVLDSMPVWQDLGESYIREKGMTPENGLSARLHAMSMDEGAAYLNTCYPLGGAEMVRRELAERLKRAYCKEIPAKPGLAALLRTLHLHGVAMAAATAGDSRLAVAALLRLGVRQYFTAVLSCDGLRTSKREGRIYQAAARCMGTAPGETLVFEDSLDALCSAKRAGFLTVAVADDSNRAERSDLIEEAGWFIRDFTEADQIPYLSLLFA